MTPVERAAREYVQSIRDEKGIAEYESLILYDESARNMFLAGHAWALAHDPAVVGLVQALERISKGLSPRAEYALALDKEEVAEICETALEAFRKAKGE